MFAEKHQDLGYLEHEFRNSLKQYRSHVRWGIDKVYKVSGKTTEELFTEIRQWLDEENISQAAASMDILLQRLRDMEQNYPAAKANLLNEIGESITFLESVLKQNMAVVAGDDVSLDFKSILTQDLEKSRVALQNEDWQEAQQLVSRILEKYLDARQASIKKHSTNVLQAPVLEEAKQKLDVLKDRGGMCKLLPVNDLESIYQMAASRNISTVRIGVIASIPCIEKLFSELSGKTIQFDSEKQSAENQGVVLRVSVSRDLTIYFTGLAVNDESDFEGLRNYLSQCSMLFLSFESNQIIKKNIERLALMSLEQISSHLVTVLGENTETLAESKLASFRNINNICLDGFNNNEFIAWINNMLDASPVFR